MPIQRKSFFNSPEHGMLVKVCSQNALLRQKLLSLLALPYENRQMILSEWMKTLKEDSEMMELVRYLEMFEDQDRVDSLIEELKKFDA